MFLFYLLSLVIIGGILFTLSTFSSLIAIEYVVGYTIAGPILATFMFYQALKKADRVVEVAESEEDGNS